MSLIKEGIVVKMINFGAMRVGDDNYAKFSESVFLDQNRFVNSNELPVQFGLTWRGFKHAGFEVY